MKRWRSLLAVRIFANEPHLLCILGTGTDLPEVTGSASVVPSSTSGTQSTNTSSPVASSRGSSDTAVIAGGVVGGVVGIALVISFVAWLTIRRGHARAAPPMEHSGGLMSDMAVVPYSQATKKPRLYVGLFYLPATARAWLICSSRSIGPFGPEHISNECTFLSGLRNGLQKSALWLFVQPTIKPKGTRPRTGDLRARISPLSVLQIPRSLYLWPLGTVIALCITNEMNETRSQPLYIRR